MRKLLFAFWLTLSVGHCAHAQIWQAYRGVWLKGYDNATQAPIPPAGYSALTYFADSLGTYVYDWDSLAWLRIPGAGGGGGGGGLTTADNGLIVNPAGNVRQGGTFNAGAQTIGLNTTTNYALSGPNLLFRLNETTDEAIIQSSGSGETSKLVIDHNGGAGLSFTSPTSDNYIQLNSNNNAIEMQVSDNISVFNNIGFTPTTFFVSILDLLSGSGSGFTMGPSETIITHTLGNDNITLHAEPGQERLRIVAEGIDPGSELQINLANPNAVELTSGTVNNFTISKPQGLTSSSGSLQIGGPDGLVTSLENTESGNTAIFDVRGTNETFAMRSGSGGSTLTVNVASSAQVNITTASDQLQLGTSNAKLLFDESDDTALFSADVVLQKVPTELDTAVWFLARDFTTGEIVQRKGTGGGGGITNDADINELPVTSDASGNLTHTGIMHSLVGSAVSPDSVRLSVGDVDMWINNADDNISMGSANSRLKFDFSDPFAPAIGVTEPFAGINGTLTLRTAGNGGFFIERDVPGDRYFTVSQAGTMTLGSTQVGGPVWTIAAANPSFNASLALNAQSSIRLLPQNNIVQIGSGSGGTYTISGGTNANPNGNGSSIVIQPGVENGSGTPGNITIDQLNGFLILANLPTTNPCGSAPAGTVWSDSGTLKVCP